MRHPIAILLGGAMASLIAIPQVLALFAQHKRANGGELRERDEIHQTYKLTPGTRVDVSNIRGPVEIETADTDVAEVRIMRSAQSRDDLAQDKVSIENDPQSLTIRGETTRRDSGPNDDPGVRQHVILKLPRRVDLSLQGIGGEVRIGDVGGQLVVNTVSGLLNVGTVGGQVHVTGVGGGVSIDHAGGQVEIKTVSGLLNVGTVEGQVHVMGVGGGVSIGHAGGQVEIKTVTGDVKIGQASDSLDVMGVGGALSAGISKLGQRGVQIDTVTGQVELRFRDELNAQLSTETIVGELSIDLPNVTVQSRSAASTVRAQIGKGGPSISISRVSKNVHLVKGS